MNAVLRAVPAPGSVPSGWAAGLDTSGYDRRVELTDPEARALAGLGVAGLRRSRARGAQQQAPWWAALTRLVEPLDTARAGLHHDDVAGYRRASRDAAGLILAHCAQTGRSYWGWTGWEWARLCGASAEEFLAARARAATGACLRPRGEARLVLRERVTLAFCSGYGVFDDPHHGRLGTKIIQDHSLERQSIRGGSRLANPNLDRSSLRHTSPL